MHDEEGCVTWAQIYFDVVELSIEFCFCPFKQRVGGNDSLLQHQDRLHDPSEPASSSEMTYVCLYGATSSESGTLNTNPM